MEKEEVISIIVGVLMMIGLISIIVFGINNLENNIEEKQVLMDYACQGIGFNNSVSSNGNQYCINQTTAVRVINICNDDYCVASIIDNECN